MNAKELKQIRRQSRLSQCKLAVALGVTGQTVYRWEAGKRPVSKAIEQLIRLKYCKEEKTEK